MLAGGDESFRENVKEAMTASTRGTMRPNGRSPPFLAIGLFIALCVMGFNYWSLSAKNAEQANEISILNSEKLTARATSEKRIESLSTQITTLQKDLNGARDEALKFKDERQAVEVSPRTLSSRHWLLTRSASYSFVKKNRCWLPELHLSRLFAHSVEGIT